MLGCNWGHSDYPSTCGSYTTCEPLTYFRSHPCEGQTYEVYKAYTTCLPTLTIQARGGAGTPNCPYQLVVKQLDKEHTIEIQPREYRTFTFDCVKEISVMCADNPSSICNISLTMYISGCIPRCKEKR
ncbi:S-Ena type endospore appendage [Pontibacillus sp. ALD_SL1]|uniref:S-Ena type endospore appendage n=1 Tax=Pontibacillus sp. ALD_SL1 TaxID=2777185 RepID=UPI0035303B67